MTSQTEFERDISQKLQPFLLSNPRSSLAQSQFISHPFDIITINRPLLHCTCAVRRSAPFDAIDFE
jgi:hypothetical protein